MVYARVGPRYKEVGAYSKFYVPDHFHLCSIGDGVITLGSILLRIHHFQVDVCKRKKSVGKHYTISVKILLTTIWHFHLCWVGWW